MNICEEVKNTRTIGISGHLRPDGDCVGAVMGLYLYLKKRALWQRCRFCLKNLQIYLDVSKA